MAQKLLSFDVCLENDVCLEPYTEYLIKTKIKNSTYLQEDSIFLPCCSKLLSKAIIGAPCLVSPQENVVPVRLYNFSENVVKLYCDTVVGTVEITNRLEKPSEKLLCIENNSTHLEKLRLSVQNNEVLSNAEKEVVVNLLNKFSQIFSKDKSDLGNYKAVEHEIITYNVPPIHMHPRRVPLGLEEQIDNQVKDMLNNGIIRESTSPWNAPLVAIKKKSGDIRLCVDYRGLNSVTMRPIYPIPETKCLLDNLEGSKLFSTVDLSSAYYQCNVREEDKKKTAFTTRHGQYECLLDCVELLLRSREQCTLF